MKFIRFIKETTFVVTRKGEDVFTMPTVVFALLMLFFWQLLIPAMIIALFFGVGYFFEGAEDTEKPNHFLEKASDFAEDARSEFTKDNPGSAGSEEI